MGVVQLAFRNRNRSTISINHCNATDQSLRPHVNAKPPYQINIFNFDQQEKRSFMAPNVNIIIRRPGPGVEEEEDFVQTAATASISVSEIEEEHSSELFEISTGSGLPSLGLDTIREEIDGNSLFSFDFHNNSGEISAVYVAIGKYSEESSSMDALVWTITHAVSDPTTTIVFLIHVFPQTKFIPMPCK